MTTPTQAQIQAALKVLSKPDCCFCDTVCLILPCKCVESALTAAAAEVGEQSLSHADKVLWNEAIERCAQMAEKCAEDASANSFYMKIATAIAAAIRALKEEK